MYFGLVVLYLCLLRQSDGVKESEECMGRLLCRKAVSAALRRAAYAMRQVPGGRMTAARPTARDVI